MNLANPTQKPVHEIEYGEHQPQTAKQYSGHHAHAIAPAPDPKHYNFVVVRPDRDPYLKWAEFGYDENGESQAIEFSGVLLPAIFVKGINFRDRLVVEGWKDITDEWNAALSGDNKSVSITVPDSPKPTRKRIKG